MKKPGLINSTKLGLKNTFEFDSTTSRADFWWFYLGDFLLRAIIVILAILTLLPFISFFLLLNHIFFAPLLVIALIIEFILLVILDIAVITATIRRFHDIGLSGWMALLFLLSFIGLILIAIFMVQEHRPNKWEYQEKALTPKKYSDNTKRYIQLRSIARYNRFNS